VICARDQECEGGERGALFDCFGSRCGVWVTTEEGSAQSMVETTRERLLDLHRRFTRFDPHSELSMLNEDPRERVPVSSTMVRFIAAAVNAAEMTGGLVDPTLVSEIEHAGYRSHLERGIAPQLLLRSAPPRHPAAPRDIGGWRQIRVEEDDLVVERPVGVRLDSGGIAKGLFADLAGEALAAVRSFGIDCAGDQRFGGQGGLRRLINVQSPFDERVLHSYDLSEGAAATSGISKRSWLDDRGCPAHHLLDPATGRPAFTGIVQATALAPNAVEAEIRAKAAILSGPERAERWLIHGGIVVYEDGTFTVIEPPAPS
jgi:thiamine biosynthesis lipoprotein